MSTFVALSDADKERVRYHLNYPNVTAIASLFGTRIRASQVQNLLEYTTERMLQESVARVQKLLTTLDAIEEQMVESMGRLKALKADVVTLNTNEHGDLQAIYSYWQKRLANQLGVPVNPSPSGSTVGGLNARLHR